MCLKKPFVYTVNNTEPATQNIVSLIAKGDGTDGIISPGAHACE
jgi:hypothetical protein